MEKAAFLMIHSCKKKGIRFSLTSRQYVLLREQYYLANAGSHHGNYDNTLYSFMQVTTGKIEKLTQYDFYTKYKIDYRGVNRLVKGKSKTCNGWCIEGSDLTRKPKTRKIKVQKEKTILRGADHAKYDHTLYTWYNDKSGEKVVSTKYDLIHTYHLNNSNVGEVARGKRHHVVTGG